MAAWNVLTTQTLEIGRGRDLLVFIFAKTPDKSMQMYVTFLLGPVSAHRVGTKCGILSSKCLPFSLSLSFSLFLQTSKEKSKMI